jgi:hypothetical protein
MDIELQADRYEAEAAEAAFIRAETEEFTTVGEIPNEFILIQSEDEVNELNSQYDQDYWYYFALVGEGEYLRLFGSYGVSTHKLVHEVKL